MTQKLLFKIFIKTCSYIYLGLLLLFLIFSADELVNLILKLLLSNNIFHFNKLKSGVIINTRDVMMKRLIVNRFFQSIILVNFPTTLL